MLDIAIKLDFLHKNNVRHGSICLANIFVSCDKKYVFLTNFKDSGFVSDSVANRFKMFYSPPEIILDIWDKFAEHLNPEERR